MRRTPLTPIFDSDVHRGTIQVAGTPGVTPLTSTLAELLKYDAREWDGSTGNMPNLTAIGSAWDIPKVPGTRWQLNPSTTGDTFDDLAGDLSVLIPSLVVVWDGFPSGADDSEVDLYHFSTVGSEYWQARLRFDVGFNVGGAGTVRVEVVLNAEDYNGSTYDVLLTRSRVWTETTGVPTTATLIVNMDPVNGGLSAKINGVDMTVTTSGSAPVAGDAAAFAAVATGRAFTGNNVEYDSEPGAVLPLQIAGMALVHGVPQSSDFAYWASQFGVTLTTSSATATPSTVTAVGAVPAPSVSTATDATVAPAVVTAVGSVETPTVTSPDAVVTPGTVTAVGSVPAPSVSAEASATATPTTITTPGSVEAPTVTSPATITPSTVTAPGTVEAPTVAAPDATAEPDTVTGAGSVPAPTVEAGPGSYDDVAATLGLMWYSAVDAETAVTWPTWSTVIAGNYADEAVRGRLWFDAWFNESTYAPADYTEAISDAGYLGTDLMWYSTVDATGSVTWPSLATVMTGNYADEGVRGRIWFDAWFNESGNAPTTYAFAIDETDPMWFAPADQLI